VKSFAPVSPGKAAARALGLAAVVCRGTMEGVAGDPKAAEMHALILRWLEAHGLEKILEPNEITILRAPPGTLERDAKAICFWRLEQLSVLAWALGKVEAPKAWERHAPLEVARKIGFLRQDADAIVEAATLRSPAEIAMYAAYVEESREWLERALEESPADTHELQAALCAAVERNLAVEWLIGERALKLEAPLLA
jgi:hypothetical protein